MSAPTNLVPGPGVTWEDLREYARCIDRGTHNENVPRASSRAGSCVECGLSRDDFIAADREVTIPEPGPNPVRLASGKPKLECPDGGTCHHDCGYVSLCFRVQHCGPLSGVFPNDEWPQLIKDAVQVTEHRARQLGLGKNIHGFAVIKDGKRVDPLSLSPLDPTPIKPDVEDEPWFPYRPGTV